MSEIFKVKHRKKTGSAETRQLRRQNLTPAVLYGHGQATVSLSIPTPDVQSAIRQGSHIVQLEGDVTENALIKEIQWDAFGSEVKHLDLTRVDMDEKIQVEVPVNLHGAAPGTNNGGVLNQMERQLSIICAAVSIPDHVEANINHLEIGDELTAKDIPLPAGAELITDANTVVVACNAPKKEEEEIEGEGVDSAEPEVIGRKPEDEEGGE